MLQSAYRFFIAFILLAVSLNASAEVEIHSWMTDRGSKVMYVHSAELPMLDIEVTFDAGAIRDGDAWGLASFTADLIGTATKNQNEDQIADRFNRIGAQFGGGASRDNASFNLRTLTRDAVMQQAFKQYVDVLSQAQFEPEIIERERKRLLLGIKQKSMKPQSVLSDQLWETLYPQHPYGHPVSGTEKTVAQLTQAEIESFYRHYYNANNAVIAIVGNVDRQQAEAMANEISRSLPKGSKPAPLAKPIKVKQAQEIKTEFPSSQTYYALAQVGIERGNKDYIPLFVGNHLFGGSGFGSYLMEEVREKRGLVYSVYSYFAPMKQNGPFVIGLSTKNASAKEADEVVRQTLADFMQDFSDERLQAIKDNLVGGFPLRIDSNGKILGYISMIGFYGLPLDYLEWFPQQVEKVTKEDILSAWKRHVHPDRMLKLMVGQPQ
ncbi:M16 family metallopeptidase [Thiomicrorhabdus xiamenensis]|uniref:Insulinase family protein n=1 Tax=Thiomicrorhabdus xiamenensis TaxID=2739063 RepID=A0A7D4NKF4_9GAMM|nr:pitrilysin family protein [Thiomicrorhabdus xiamenensis]QKI88354.1 insulinase family protein [Thiomicrorhabdus xiamenensis]